MGSQPALLNTLTDASSGPPDSALGASLETNRRNSSTMQTHGAQHNQRCVNMKAYTSGTAGIRFTSVWRLMSTSIACAANPERIPLLTEVSPFAKSDTKWGDVLQVQLKSQNVHSSFPQSAPNCGDTRAFGVSSSLNPASRACFRSRLLSPKTFIHNKNAKGRASTYLVQETEEKGCLLCVRFPNAAVAGPVRERWRRQVYNEDTPG